MRWYFIEMKLQGSVFQEIESYLNEIEDYRLNLIF